MDDAEYCIVAYGIQSILSSAVKALVILGVGVISGYFTEVLVSMLVFGWIRHFAGGFHCKTNIGCLGAMLFICFFPIAMFNVKMKIAKWIWLLLLLYSIYEIARYAPRNSVVNPINDIAVLKKKRIGSLISVGIAGIILVLCRDGNIKWLVTLPLFCEAVTISPIFFRKR